jgi:hypothetical protein
MKFGDLKTGDVLTLAGQTAVILAVEKPHPKNRAFWLIVWYIFDEKRISCDMLHPDYELIPGSVVHSDGFQSWHTAMGEMNR